LGLTTVAFAQQPAAPAAAPTADARELFRRGEAAYSAGNYEVAIREWNNAYSVDPRPRIQFNLSQAYERLGELEKAMDALKKFLDSGDPDDPMYSDANARLSALQQRLALTGVVVKGGADGGTILVDEKDWGRTPRPDKINVAPGSHVLVVHWADRPEFRTNISVPAGQVIEVAIPDNGAATLPVTTPQVATNVDSGKGVSPMVWYSIGGALAAVGIGGIVYGAVRSGDAIDCGGSTYCPNPGDADSAKTQSMVGIAGGAVLLVGGIALGVVGFLKSRKEKQTASAGTTCGIGLASASCRIRF